MAERALITNGRLETNNWTILTEDEAATLSPNGIARGSLIPLSTWEKSRQELTDDFFEHCGIWIDSHESPLDIGAGLERLQTIAINFPLMKDGRGYSHARILRDRLKFRGEIRAIGYVTVDLMDYMRRCGFDGFLLNPDQDPEVALRNRVTFSESYQANAVSPPVFERRDAGQVAP